MVSTFAVHVQPCPYFSRVSRVFQPRTSKFVLAVVYNTPVPYISADIYLHISPAACPVTYTFHVLYNSHHVSLHICHIVSERCIFHRCHVCLHMHFYICPVYIFHVLYINPPYVCLHNTHVTLYLYSLNISPCPVFFIPCMLTHFILWFYLLFLQIYIFPDLHIISPHVRLQMPPCICPLYIFPCLSPMYPCLTSVPSPLYPRCIILGPPVRRRATARPARPLTAGRRRGSRSRARGRLYSR